ncbi:hypothetical protein SAMN05421504_11139 [Amycolatopsis xylanica]|uniref:Uncharacterized protein n=1 Tax=Amycolatopsis xylanica TaxID=589385 RepID=A0A1H3RFB9_9PSEU|nr:hypothetical protein [Amycolatopsis xylanica]SDZ24015.1 hypothetical protein SAMN05421504_11139 [Amycolatopsis xylanica]
MTDPVSDDFPVLLGPVRVETRFTATELLVRIFPDDWSIDKIEELPTQAELRALDAYWIAFWRAGGNAAGEQAAWQELAGRIPAGRATWLLRDHRPDNPADKPAGVQATTTVLIVFGQQAVAAGDRAPSVAYWTAVWRAHGDRARLRDAEIALRAAVGPDRAAAIRARRPAGIDAAAVTPGNDVVVAFLVVKPPPPAKIAPESWTVPAKATLLPDHFTVFGYIGDDQVFALPCAQITGDLEVSPDPGADDKPKINDDGSLHVPDALRWLTEFQRAVDIGMGLRIKYSEVDARVPHGLTRLVVLGLRGRSTPQRDAEDLAALFGRQLHSPAGFSLLPQGTPTNNTEQAPAGQHTKDEATAALRSMAGFTGEESTKDGQWFAELLGIDPASLDGMPNADRTDQADARAANTALWPATWGNFLRTTLNPIVSEQVIAQTRDFFLRYVSGRGPIPAVKIGRQPYGVIATTAFSRLKWPVGTPHRPGLHALLQAAAADWDKAVAKVTHLDGEHTDPHQSLLDILALHPGSAEFYQRYAQSVDDLFNRENLGGEGHRVLSIIERLQMAPPIKALLRRLGATGDPDLLGRLFVGDQHPLIPPLIDDRPLSETDLIGNSPKPAKNYLAWLAANAADLEIIRQENGFEGDARPSALLYLMLRHAVLLGWAEAGRRLAQARGSAVPSPADPPFIHIADVPGHPEIKLPSESRYRQLYSPDPNITGNAEPLHKYIPGVLGTDPATAELAEQVRALAALAKLPTARLERVFTEHLDLATYRLDAWRLGLATERLHELRYATGTARRGVHIGAYGWLENIEPKDGTLPTKPVPDGLASVFGADELPHDENNGGYIHAPSPAQARTAAVLRAGYLANRTTTHPESFAVNLSSDRVRVALSILDGLRQGQTLSALLGYRFERGLHEGHPDLNLDRFLQPLRGAFPLRAGKLSESGAPDDVKLVEARNVVDGLELVRRATRVPATPTYPFGATGLPETGVTDDEKKAMNEEVQNLLAIHDALGDLAVAEGTHQALLGNTERASATLDSYAKEGFPPDPEVVKTPRSGITLTHRFGLQLTPGLGPDSGAPLLGRNGPRGRAEPAVNAWLKDMLPPASKVAARVTWTDPITKKPADRVVTMEDLGLQPIDLLWAVRSAGEGELTDLDDRIVGVVVAKDQPRPDAKLKIVYSTRIPEKVTFFELSPLIASLRTLFTTSRPLRAADLVPGAGLVTTDSTADDTVTLPKERPVAVLESLNDLLKKVKEFDATLTPLLPEVPDRAKLLTGIDTFLGTYAGLAAGAGRFGLLRSGWGELTLWRQGVFREVLDALAVTVARMTKSLAAADLLLEQYGRLPPSTSDEARFKLLEQALRLLTTTPGPRDATPAKMRTAVVAKRQAFNTKLQALSKAAVTTKTTLSGLLAEASAKPPVTDFDQTGLDLAPFGDRVVEYGRELLTRTKKLGKEIEGRVTACGKALVAYDAAVTGADRAEAGTDALKALLGADVLTVPEFTPSEQLAEDWRDARRASDDLIDHLKEAPHHRDYPVDDWLHGMARIREKPRLWEKTVFLADALLGSGGLLPSWTEPELTPIQLPYRDDDTWLAMDFSVKPKPKLNEDRVLFTAHYAAEPILGNGRHCGLLFDEWTEVIPAETETTGIAVHYDRPDSEPPQALLLVVPPAADHKWQPGDLLAAIHETFALAKARAVEPEHLDDTAYAQLLPATVMSATRKPITISTDLAVANLRWKATHD